MHEPNAQAIDALVYRIIEDKFDKEKLADSFIKLKELEPTNGNMENMAINNIPLGISYHKTKLFF